ncbi:hypothetical protein L195_g026040, partial [Trifolium pratense]
VGEWVFLKLRPHRQQSVAKRINQKLAARFYGPFEIVDRIGEVAYKLKLPDHSKIHPVFHASLLKKVIGNYHAQSELPKELEITAEEDVYPEKILGSRVVMQNGVATHQSLVQWKHKSLDDVTWEENSFLKGQFPEVSLEDKAGFIGEGIDEDVGLEIGPKQKIWRVYTRQRGKGKK